MVFVPAVLRASIMLAFAPIALALPQKTPDVRLDSGDAPGDSVSESHRMVAEGDSVFAVWNDYRNGFDSDIYFNRSLDAGRRWLPAAVRIDTVRAAGASGSLGPELASQGSSVYVVWSEWIPNVPESEVYCNRSLDAGTTWLTSPAKVDLGVPPGTINQYPAIAASGASVYVAWQVIDFNEQDLYFNRSLDGGATWLPTSISIDLDPANPDEAGRVQLAAEGSAVHAVWKDGDTDHIYYNRSLDAGTTWLPEPVQIDLMDPQANFADGAQLVVSGSSVYVSWGASWNSVNSDVYFNGSVDGGTTWLPAAVRLNSGIAPGSALSEGATLAASGDSVYVTWYDTRNSPGISQPPDIYFNRSLDGGATWLPTDMRIDFGTPPGTEGSINPRIAASGDAVHVVWLDGQNGDNDPFFNRSLDQGTTWLPAEVRVNLGRPPGLTWTNELQIALAGPNVHVAWQDNRNGEFDIFYTLALGYQPYGAGTPGTGGLVPALAGSGEASIGSTTSLDVTNGRGGALCALVYGFSGPAEILSKWGILRLLPPWSSIRFFLGGASGVPGAGTGSVPAAIPNDLSLIGMRVNFQAATFDPGAPKGIALSRGLELWVL